MLLSGPKMKTSPQTQTIKRMDKASLRMALGMGRRPFLPEDTPEPLRDLIKEMWHTLPSRRPDALTALRRIDEVYPDHLLEAEYQKFVSCGGAALLPRPVREALA
mmetsp:Transcript_30478/g.97258  ORF Transcript_30478/g.97258 Transcript_30478/m.97258 type:complete len:105 (-) Transcript_30478:105-419(-)